MRWHRQNETGCGAFRPRNQCEKNLLPPQDGVQQIKSILLHHGHRHAQRQLKGRDLGERLLIPVNMLRHGGDVFLDDVRVPDVEAALGVPVTVVEQDGFDLLGAVLGRK